MGSCLCFNANGKFKKTTIRIISREEAKRKKKVDKKAIASKKLGLLVQSHKHVCDELDEKMKNVYTILSAKENELLEQLETLFNNKQEELIELQMDHEKDKESFKIKPEILVFGNEYREAFATLLGLCFFQLHVSASHSLLELYENSHWFKFCNGGYNNNESDDSSEDSSNEDDSDSDDDSEESD